jgi:hypothetical protein
MDLIQITEIMGNLGEFVGSFAVLATLLYVALQLRQSRELLEENRRIALSQVHQARMDSRSNLHQAATTNDISSILSKLHVVNHWDVDVEHLQALDEQEIVKLTHYVEQQVLLVDNNVYQSSLGLLDLDNLISPQRRKHNAERMIALTEELGIEVSQRTADFWRKNTSIEA